MINHYNIIMKSIQFNWDNNSEENIRIISARKSTKNEEKQYKEYLS